MTGLPDDDASAVRRDVDRVVAFSDGVFAIAITLLILSIDVPDVADGRLGDALEDLVPFILTYALSFGVVGVYWIAHHRMFRSVRHVDRRLLWINLFVLGSVALLPVPTEILGRYGNTTLGTVVYAAAISLVGGLSVLLWWYLNHADLTTELKPDVVHLSTLRGAIPPVVFAASIPMAFLDPEIAKLFWITIWPINVWAERKYGREAYGPA